MRQNAVTVLRDKWAKQITRPFAARGSKLKRCSDCLLVKHHCICAHRPVVKSRCAFCLIFYQGEVLKPSNTGRLIADIVDDSYAFQWQRTELEPELASLLEDPRYVPIVVFPHEYAQTRHCINSLGELPKMDIKQKPLFIVLDGTWREAKKMFRSEYLASFPVLGLNPEEESKYLLREPSRSHQLCTAEVGVEVLALAGEEQVSEALENYFELFRERYLASKANVVLT